MKVIVVCEFSGIVRDAFAKKGHDAWSCDLRPCERKGSHLQGDARLFIGPCEANNFKHWDLMIAHPPCTYLCVSANRWLKDQPDRKSGKLVGAERRQAREQAVEFFIELANADIPRICIENPVGIMSRRYKPPTQIIHPYFFGHEEVKKTCL
jgi:hypothetical protein